MDASGTQIEPTRVIREAFEVYRSQAGPVLGGAAIVIGIAGVVNGIFSSSGSFFLVLLGELAFLVASVLFTGYVVKLVQDVRDGRLDQSIGELFAVAAPYIGTLILNGILFGLAVVVGFLLLIVPGLILITIWAVVAPSIVVENRGAIEAFGRSRELVRGNGWPVFGAIVLAFLIIIAVSIAMAAIGSAIADDAGLVILGTIGNVLVAPIAALVSAILFFDLGGGAGAIEPSPERAT
jgi:ABC-type uncharacterized transport system permease subunit